MRNFRNYDVWNAGVEFSVHVYELTEKFPRKASDYGHFYIANSFSHQ